MTHYLSLFNFLMANWNWATVLVLMTVLGGVGERKSR